jgi:hypothetical protein
MQGTAVEGTAPHPAPTRFLPASSGYYAACAKMPFVFSLRYRQAHAESATAPILASPLPTTIQALTQTSWRLLRPMER